MKDVESHPRVCTECIWLRWQIVVTERRNFLFHKNRGTPWLAQELQFLTPFCTIRYICMSFDRLWRTLLFMWRLLMLCKCTDVSEKPTLFFRVECNYITCCNLPKDNSVCVHAGRTSDLTVIVLALRCSSSEYHLTSNKKMNLQVRAFNLLCNSLSGVLTMSS